MTLFFLFCKGDVRKNSTLWVAFGFMTLLGGVDLGILHISLKLSGPKGWDWLQLHIMDTGNDVVTPILNNNNHNNLFQREMPMLGSYITRENDTLQ